jgi:predicted dehydrogenase
MVGYAKAGRFGKLFYAESDYFQNLGPHATKFGDEQGWRELTPPMIYSTHSILPLRHVLRDEFTEVYCIGSKSKENANSAQDLQVALLRTRRGLVAKVAVSWCMQRTYCLYYSFYGTRGTYERARAEWDKDKMYISDIPFMNEMMPLPVPFSSIQKPLVPATPHDSYWWRVRAKLLRQPPQQLDRSSEIEMVDDFVQAVLKKREPKVNIRETALTTMVGLCANKSAQSIDRVKIPLDPAKF